MAMASAILLPAKITGSRILTPHSVLHKILSPLHHTLSFHRRRRRFLRTAAATAELENIGSPGLVALEYAHLNLADKFSEEVGHVRVRPHVNPLRRNLMVPAQVPDWNEVFEDATLPLMVDIGCGSGRFLLSLAKGNSSYKNYLGLEIKRILVDRAKHWVGELALRNVHFISVNASVSFKELVSTYPGPLMMVSILCPDPHFKRKYRKRRVVQKPLVESIVDRLVPGGQVLIQSDVFEVAVDMRDQFDAESNKIIHVTNINPSVHIDSDGWLLSNPMGIRTEREVYAESEGARIYRRLYEKLK